jgi:hypothetical protein
MSLHKVYCAVCFKNVEVELAGRPHYFKDHPIHCPCKEDESVVIKGLFDNTVDDYGLFMISDLEPSISIIQAVLEAQGKPPMIIS